MQVTMFGFVSSQLDMQSFASTKSDLLHVVPKNEHKTKQTHPPTHTHPHKNEQNKHKNKSFHKTNTRFYHFSDNTLFGIRVLNFGTVHLKKINLSNFRETIPINYTFPNKMPITIDNYLLQYQFGTCRDTAPPTLKLVCFVLYLKKKKKKKKINTFLKKYICRLQ